MHSPVGQNPQDYGVRLIPLPELPAGRTFAKNDIGFIDPTGTDHDALGIGLEENVRQWFDFNVPNSRVDRNRIAKALGTA